MSTLFTSRLALLSALVSLAGPGFGAEDRIRGPIESQASIVLKGNVHPGALPANDRGALDPSSRIEGVKLELGQTPEQGAALVRLLEEQRDPASANYHNWLSPEEYGERFGVSEHDLGQLTSWLEWMGLTVDQVARAQNWIAFSGSAERIGFAFRTELRYYRVDEADGEKHFANASAPSIPASLAGIVTAVRGLDNFRPRPQRSVTTTPDFNASNGSHYLAPGDLATIYDIQALYQAGYDGAGQKLVIAGQTDINLADIRAFRVAFGLTARDPQLVLAGADPGVSKNDQIEADLDVEWAGAIARNATIVYVYSPNVFESLEYAIDQNVAPVVSVSYGGCEIGSSASYRTLAQQANAQGITWMNASGDSGAAGCDAGAKIATHGPSVTFPADIPEVTAVGGTEFNDVGGSYWSNQNNAALSSALSYIPETAWNDTALGNGLAAGGGGASALYAKPWWQTGPGVPNDQARDVPDISLAASGAHDAYVIYCNGALIGVGGTSASSPSLAGIAAILNQYLVAKGTLSKPGLGNINPALYSLAQGTTGVFHDITGGNNIVPCATGVAGCVSGSYGYKAGTGYDLATGLGSVDAYNLVTRWNSLPPGVGTTLTLLASPGSIAPTATAQLTATVSAVTGTATPTGVVAFASGTTPLGSVTVARSGAVATAILQVKASGLLAGVNSITATFTGMGSFSGSTATTAVTVTTPAIATSISLIASPSNIAQSASTVLTAVVKALIGNVAPAGNVSFTLGNIELGSATLAASSTGVSAAALTVKGATLAAGPNAIVAAYAGGAGFSGSSASPVVVTVAPSVATTTTVVTASPTTIAQTASTAVTAKVSPSAGTAPPTGTVAFTLGNIPLGTVPLSSDGSTAGVTLLVKASSLVLGSNTITASYSGSTSFRTSAGSVSVIVNSPPAATSIALIAAPNSLAPSATTTVTATVRAALASVGPAGSVAFTVGNIVLGIVPLTLSGSAGTAALTVKGSSLAGGANTIAAVYLPAGNLSGASTSVSVTVVPAVIGTTMGMTATPATIASTASTLLTVTLRANTGSASPTGTIAFLHGSAPLGSAALTGSGGVATATLTVKGSALAAGSNIITASYAGGSFSAAVAAITVNVAAAAK